MRIFWFVFQWRPVEPKRRCLLSRLTKDCCILKYCPLLENARSSKNWISPIQNFPAKTIRRFSTDSVLMATGGGQHYQLASSLLPLPLLLRHL